MKILDAGTEVLDDRDVLKYIKEKHAQHAAYAQMHKTKSKATSGRPENYLRALRRHEEHLEHAERPFLNNEHYDSEGNYANTLMAKLEPKVQLTKTELLMLINHRPGKREMLLPMIEDVESRFSDEEQEWIVETVMEVLGTPGPMIREGDGQADGGAEQADGDAEMGG